MSTSSQGFDVLKHRKSLGESFDEILVLADDLLKDECPISEVDEWLFRIDDTLLQLKLWSETIGVEQGLLEDIVLDEDLCWVIGEMLRNIILPLHKIEEWCKDSETEKLPQIKSRYVSQKRGACKTLPDTLSIHLLLIQIQGYLRLSVNSRLLPTDLQTRLNCSGSGTIRPSQRTKAFCKTSIL